MQISDTDLVSQQLFRAATDSAVLNVVPYKSIACGLLELSSVDIVPVRYQAYYHSGNDLVIMFSRYFFILHKALSSLPCVLLSPETSSLSIFPLHPALFALLLQRIRVLKRNGKLKRNGISGIIKICMSRENDIHLPVTDTAPVSIRSNPARFGYFNIAQRNINFLFLQQFRSLRISGRIYLFDPKALFPLITC